MAAVTLRASARILFLLYWHAFYY